MCNFNFEIEFLTTTNRTIMSRPKKEITKCYLLPLIYSCPVVLLLFCFVSINLTLECASATVKKKKKKRKKFTNFVIKLNDFYEDVMAVRHILAKHKTQFMESINIHD